MKLSCPNCNTSFNIKDISVFSGEKNYVKCCKCYYVWDITQFIQKHQYSGVSGFNTQDNNLGAIHELKPKTKKITKKTSTCKKIILFLIIFLAFLFFACGTLIYNYHRDNIINKKINITNIKYQNQNSQYTLTCNLVNNTNNTIVSINGIQLALFDFNNNLFQIIYISHPIALHLSEKKHISAKYSLDSIQQEKLSNIHLKVY